MTRRYKITATGQVLQQWELPAAFPNVGGLLHELPQDILDLLGLEAVPDVAQVQTPEQVQSLIVATVQDRLDVFAQTRNYDSILSACTYATSSITKFASEGQTAIALRDSTWGVLYEVLAQVQAGTRPMPAGFGDIEGELPILEWMD